MTVIVATHTSATGQRHAVRTLACGSPVVNTQQSWSPTPVYTKVSAAAAPPIVRPPSKVLGRSLSGIRRKFPAPARLRSVQPPTSHIRQSFAICEAWGHYSQKIQHASDDKCRYLRSRHSIVYESAECTAVSLTPAPIRIPRHSPPSLRSPRSMKSCLCFGCFGGGLVFFSPCHFEVITRGGAQVIVLIETFLSA